MGRKKADEKAIECPEYDALVQGMEDARAKVAEAGKAAVGALFKAYFAEYPQIKAVGWTQYTPHFNDGDPCEFSTCEFTITTDDADFAEVDSVSDDHGDEKTDGPTFKSSYNLKGALKVAAERIARAVNEDLFEAAFGDHVMVIATPAGFHVNEYSHD